LEILPGEAGENKAVCKRVEVGSLSLLIIPVVISKNVLNLNRKMSELFVGKKFAKAVLRSSVVHRQPAEKLHC
jgi:hypothetical protein